MKQNLLLICLTSLFFYSCDSNKNTTSSPENSNLSNIQSSTSNEVSDHPNHSHEPEEESLSHSHSQSVEDVSLEKNPVHSITFKNKAFLYAQVSPDGKYILTTQEGNVGLFIYEVSTEKLFASISQDRRIGYGAQWSLDSKKVYYKEKKDYELMVYEYSLDQALSNPRADINANALQSYVLATKPKDPIISLNLSNLQVERVNLDGTGLTELTNDQGQYYNPLLSPDQKKLVIQEGSKMYLISPEGGSKKEIADGIASCWSPDSKIVYYFMDESKDGHEISGSEVYSYHTQTQKIKQITKTPDIAEMYPSISQDGKILYCTDEKTGSLIQIKP